MTDTNDLMEIHRALGRIEGKQDAILQEQGALKNEHANMRVEIDKVKSRLNIYAGGISVIVAVVMVLKDKLLAAIL